MEITLIEDQGFAHLKASGRIDSSTAARFEQVLLAQLADRGQSVLVDLGAVDFVSSAGLRVFLVGARRIRGSAVSLVLCAMDDNIRRVFAMSGFDRILQIAPDVASGRKILSG